MCRGDAVSVDDAYSRKAIIPRGRKLEAVNIMVKKKTNIGERVSIAVLGCVLLVMVRTGEVQAGGTLTLISNPTSAAGDLFGLSVAAVGTDKIIVGAPGDDTNGENAGAAYLFDLSGTLLQTYTSPEELANENFGILVTGVGTDKVLITAVQALDEEGSPTFAGRAYLFDLSGNLLESFTNPNPTIGDLFGVGADMGNDKLVFGSPGDDTDATNAGKVYQYDLTIVAPVPPGTISGTVQYTGSMGPGTLLVGVFEDAVPIGYEESFDVSNPSSGGWVSIVGNPGTYNIEVPPGTYYPVFAYNLDGFGRPSPGEPYIYYNNSGSTPVAPVVVVSSATVNLNAQTITDANLFIGIEVTVTYTGAQNGGVVDEVHPIIVHVYTDDQFTNYFTDNVMGQNSTQGIVTYSDTYYVRTWFDANANDTFDHNEPFVFHSGLGTPPGTPIVVSGISAINVTLDDTFLNPDGLEGDPDVWAPASPAPIQMFSDPTPFASAVFGMGFPVVALDSDRFVVGVEEANAEAGELHVFDITTGLLVQTLQHPDSSFSLVSSVSAFGPDHVLVGSEHFFVSAVADAGGAFLFDVATGSIILTLENPAPEIDDGFGISVAALGTGRIAVGADLDNPGGLNNAGTVYIYDDDGTLIDTINKPVPVAGDQFGLRLVAVGTGALVIGAPGGDRLGFFSGPGEVWVLTDLCPADTNNNGTVNVTDLLALLASWGLCTAPCPSDIDGNGTVNVSDLLALLAAWGACP